MEAVQKVKCINGAWFVLSFELAGRNGIALSSPDLPIQRAGLLDLAEGGFEEGEEVKLRIKAAMGRSLELPKPLCFVCNGKTAVFEVSGTSLNFNMRLVGVEDRNGPD